MPKHPHENKSGGRGCLILTVIFLLLTLVYLRYADKTLSFFHYPGKGIRGISTYYQQYPLQDASRNFAIIDRDSNMIVLLESRPHVLNPGNGENIPPGEHVRYKIERYMNITQTFRKNPSQTAVFIGDDLPDGGYEISRSPNTLIIIDKTSGEQEQITIQPGDALRFRDTLKRYHRQN